jgi:predicted  nucleic acid-binding Zn-ribbon protein
MARYLHTLDNHYDDLFSHCTHLNSRVESLEQQIKELKEEKASLQESLNGGRRRGQHSQGLPNPEDGLREEVKEARPR